MPLSLKGNIYYILFIDDSSRNAWIYFMKTKNKSFGKFQYFKDFVENQRAKMIKMLRFDNGG